MNQRIQTDSVAVRLDRVSKRYRAGRSRTLVDLIASSVDRVRGKDHAVFSLSRGRTNSDLWALRDVSFDVPEGTGVGIIGSNGAGKTTLLKLISRVTWPTSGRVGVAGRVVSLIELGAGFHPELTGRENVYLGAGLFGLTRREIDTRLERIVEFAEVEELLETPMKRYSSGLYARLGFSVAIHSDPDIVLVDEVLAVGDAAFRRRALESLRRLISEGKTVVFVSHDMWNVRRLCDRIVWMDSGRVRAMGAASEMVDRYMEEVNVRALAAAPDLVQTQRGGTGEVRFTDVEIIDGNGRPARLVREGAPLVVRAAYQAAARHSSQPLAGTVSSVVSPVFQVGIVDVETGVVVATATSPPLDASADAADSRESPGSQSLVECIFDSLPLRPRQYAVRLTITDAHQLVSYDVLTAGPRFAVTAAADRGPTSDDSDGVVSLAYRFEHRVRVLS